jgi:hypothetical protein
MTSHEFEQIDCNVSDEFAARTFKVQCPDDGGGSSFQPFLIIAEKLSQYKPL